eukprot:792464-Amphidinium_carterae.1
MPSFWVVVVVVVVRTVACFGSSVVVMCVALGFYSAGSTVAEWRRFNACPCARHNPSATKQMDWVFKLQSSTLGTDKPQYLHRNPPNMQVMYENHKPVKPSETDSKSSVR